MVGTEDRIDKLQGRSIKFIQTKLQTGSNLNTKEETLWNLWDNLKTTTLI